VRWGGKGGEDDGEEEDEVCNFHSIQLYFTCSKIPINLGVSFLKITALPDF